MFIYFHLPQTPSEREELEKDLPYVGLFLKCPQEPVLGLVKARSQEPHAHLPGGQQGLEPSPVASQNALVGSCAGSRGGA